MNTVKNENGWGLGMMIVLMSILLIALLVIVIMVYNLYNYKEEIENSGPNNKVEFRQ